MTAAQFGALPSARSGLAAVTFGGTAYLLGGCDAGRFPAGVLATRDGRQFRTVARLPVPACYAAAAAIGAGSGYLAAVPRPGRPT